MKQLICAADIEALKQAGKTVCVTGPDVIVTPSAKDAAEALGITFSDKEPEKAACTCDGEGIDSEQIYQLLKALMDKGLLGELLTKCGSRPYQCVTHENGLKVVRGKVNIGVKGDDFDCLFSLLNGGLVSYRYAGKEMIGKIPMPNFWRAPVDNDNGSMAPGRYAQWKIASMYISHRNGGMFDNVPTTVEETEHSVTITYTYYMPTTPASKCQAAYTVYGDGTVETKLTYDPVEGLPDMPEFGMMFKLNADYDNVEWYGYGPEETYADRRHGAKLGIYKNKAADNMAKYLVPQECGNKVGVRYAKVTDDRGRGLLFSGDELSFSALPYTPHELENAAHPYELPQVHYTVVRVALAQMGVGGDDSWGAWVHPEYHIDVTKPLEFTFRFKGI